MQCHTCMMVQLGTFRLNWLFAPLRKWDTLAQTGRMFTTCPNEPVQIRYQRLDELEDAVANTLLPQHELPITIPTQVSL